MDAPLEKISEWKREHGVVNELRFRKQQYVFRPINFVEIEEIANHHEWSSADQEDQLVTLALLWPEDFDIDSVPPGLVTNIADEIRDASGHGSVHTIIEIQHKARQEVSAFKSSVFAFIIAAMPSYTKEDLDAKNIHELMYLLSLAEEILKLRGIANGAEVTSPLRLHIKTPEEIEAEEAERLDDGNAKKSDPVAQKLQHAAMMEGFDL